MKEVCYCFDCDAGLRL